MAEKPKNSGLAWHAYHADLLSYCGNYDIRVTQIKASKPANEIPTRLALVDV